MRVVSATLLALMLAGCRSEPPSVGERWFDALNRRDKEAISELMDPDASFIDPSSPVPLSRTTYLGALDVIWAQWPQQQYVVRRIVPGAGVTAVEWQARQVDRQGRAVRVAGITLLTGNDQRAVEVRNYYYALPDYVRPTVPGTPPSR